MAHHSHLPYNTHMLRHMEWAKAGATTVEMLTGAPSSVSMTTPVSPTTVSIASAPGTWPAAASELCEVVLNECLRQQHQAAMAAVVHQQTTPSVVTTSSTITIAQDHEVPTLSTVSMDEVLRADMLSGQTLIAPGTTVTLPLQVVSTMTPGKSRRCSKHHHHHHHHHHSASQHDKLSYTVASYPCRYRLPSADLLPNHEELVAAGAIPSSPPPPHTMVLAPQPHAQPPPPPPPVVVPTPEVSLSAPPVPESTITSPTKQRKPRASRARGGISSSRKSSGQDGTSTTPPLPTPVTSTSTFPCPECGKKFLWASRLVVHRRSHTGEKPFPCTQCGAAFAQRWILAVHMRTHNPPEITSDQQTHQQVDDSDDQIVRQSQPLMVQQVQQRVEI